MDKKLLEIMDEFSSLNVIVLGEAMLDTYLRGSSDHLSYEAPVPVVSISERDHIPGGAANTAINVKTLAGRVQFLSVVGNDAEGRALMDVLEEQGVSTDNVYVDCYRQTLAKQRVMAETQMVVRFDQGSTDWIDVEAEDFLIERLQELFPACDALIISDYDYGIFTQRVIQTLERLQKQHPTIIVADSKQLTRYRKLNLTAVKPNYAQATQLLHLPKLEDFNSRIEQIVRNGDRILDITNAHITAVTMDRDGALIFERDRPLYRTYARPAPYITTSGAGDTFVAALTMALSTGSSTPAATEIASAAASIVVQKNGTSACFVEELLGYFSGEEKILTDTFLLAARVAAYRHQGSKIVFTNGCFDILHRGHITYLNQAKEYGDILIVGVNSDESVQRLKGPNRPINTLDDRVQVLSALSCVDHIVAFHQDTPHELIKVVKPDIFVKGGDYTRETLPEASLVEELGGEVRILPYVKQQSTTGVIERIRKQSELEGLTQ
jgi:D-beta-D-heptose 7-phosphate kinase / D-beta-D-heptose 1-phosphate adenosyltransferase